MCIEERAGVVEGMGCSELTVFVVGVCESNSGSNSGLRTAFSDHQAAVSVARTGKGKHEFTVWTVRAYCVLTHLQTPKPTSISSSKH